MAPDWEETYKATVLDPAKRAGNRLPQDLFARYALTGAHQEPDRFAGQIQAAVRYWNKLANTRVYKPLAEALLAAHQELRQAESLTWPEFTRLRDEARRRAADRLAGWIAKVRAGIPYVTAAAVSHLVDLGGGLLTDKDVRQALAQGGVKLIDPEWDVPDRPPVPAAVAMPRSLHLLGLRMSPQVVFPPESLAGGFRIKDGFRLSGGSSSKLTADLIHRAKADQAKRPHDTRKTAIETVLTTLATADRGGVLDQLIRWEAAETVRSALGNGLPAGVAADILAELGLDRGEALELAVTLAPGSARQATAGDDTALVLAALAAGNLREAQSLLAAATGDGAVGREARDRVQRQEARLAALIAEADAADRADRPEETARLLAEAARLAGDDGDLAARLGRIPPPPVTGVEVRAEHGRVAVRWQPSPARTGRISYRVVRHAGSAAVSPDDGDPVADTTANTAVDAAPPVARPICYSVFAIRASTTSPGAAAEPVTLLPPVDGLALSAEGISVTGVWQPHPEVAEVTVVRARVDGSGAGQRIATAPGPATGFVDGAVELGCSYSYRVTAVYLGPAGERLEGPAVTRHVVAEHAPSPVTDLRAELVPGGDPARMRLSWTGPTGGRVEIRRAAAEPPWHPGEPVTLAAVDGYGGPVRLAARSTGSGGCEAIVPAGQGRFVLAAVTRGSGRAVAGNSVTLELAETVTGLRARRQGDTIHVAFLWPEGIHEVRVDWSTPDDAGTRAWTRRAYQDEGGVVLSPGPARTEISVRTVVRERHVELLSAPVVADVPGRPPRVTWWLERSRLPRPRRLLVLSVDQPCEIPVLVLTTPAPAGSPGRELVRVPACWVAGDQDRIFDVSAVVPVALIPAVRCETAEPDHAGISLVRRKG